DAGSPVAGLAGGGVRPHWWWRGLRLRARLRTSHLGSRPRRGDDRGRAVGRTAGRSGGVGPARDLSHGDGLGRDAGPTRRRAARHRAGHCRVVHRAGPRGVPRGAAGSVDRGARRRRVRDLSRQRPRHRAAAGRQRHPVQDRFRDRDRHAARDRHRNGPGASVAGGAQGAPRRGRRGCPRGRDVSLARHRRRRRMTSLRRGLMLALAAVVSVASPGYAHLVNTGFGPFYHGVTHLFVTPEDLLPVVALALLAGLDGPRSGRTVLFALPAAWLAGSVLGFLVAPAMTMPAVMAAVTHAGRGVVAAGR